MCLVFAFTFLNAHANSLDSDLLERVIHDRGQKRWVSGNESAAERPARARGTEIQRSRPASSNLSVYTHIHTRPIDTPLKCFLLHALESVWSKKRSLSNLCCFVWDSDGRMEYFLPIWRIDPCFTKREKKKESRNIPSKENNLILCIMFHIPCECENVILFLEKISRGKEL